MIVNRTKIVSCYENELFDNLRHNNVFIQINDGGSSYYYKIPVICQHKHGTYRLQQRQLKVKKKLH